MGFLGFGNSAEFTDDEIHLLIDMIFNYEKTLNITDKEAKKKEILDYVLRELFDTGKQWCKSKPTWDGYLSEYSAAEILKCILGRVL